MTRQPVTTPDAPSPIGPYSQGIDAGQFLFCSGQVGLDPATGRLAGGLEAQVEQTLRNLGAVLRAAGLDYPDVVKTTIFLIDLDDFKAVNAVYARFFADAPPARSTFAVAGLPGGASVEIEAIAVQRTA